VFAVASKADGVELVERLGADRVAEGRKQVTRPRAPGLRVPRGVYRRSYDGEPSTRAFTRLNELVTRAPFHVELSKVYPLDATSQALRDVQHHHVGKLVIKIDGA